MKARFSRLWLLALGLCFAATKLEAGIHRAPIILKAKQIKSISRYPIEFYRLYRTQANGTAVPIPFQIDEVNELGDYVLEGGPLANSQSGNRYFDGLDELSFMGDDVGPIGPPKTWPASKKPDVLYELTLHHPDQQSMSGAVYIGIFFRNPPAAVQQRYVIFDVGRDQIRTSRYSYHFDPQNYLVVDNIMMRSRKEGAADLSLIDSSTFFMKADLKYFLTVNANHRSVDSRLEAFRSGPIRTIVRVSFFYTFLKLKFEVGMYTEVSFFSNLVILPAVMYMPIDGVKHFNEGSGFYYGFALQDNPSTLDFQTNMSSMEQASSTWLNLLKRERQMPEIYWASLVGADRMMYVELQPSAAMIQARNIPRYYLRSEAAANLPANPHHEIRDLKESPVNLALYFDLTKFKEGEHQLGFQLFFENKRDDMVLEEFKALKRWTHSVKRI